MKLRGWAANQALSSAGGDGSGAGRNSRGKFVDETARRLSHSPPQSASPQPCHPAPSPPNCFVLTALPIVPAANGAPTSRLCDMQVSRLVPGRDWLSAHHCPAKDVSCGLRCPGDPFLSAPAK